MMKPHNVQRGRGRWPRAIVLAWLLGLVTGVLADDRPAAGRRPGNLGERLVYALPPGWELAYQARADNHELKEFLPVGHSVDSWTEMLTVSIHYGAKDGDPDALLTETGRQSRVACPSQWRFKVFSGEENGYRTAVQYEQCGLYLESGMGEISLFKMIQGRDSLYMVVHARRLPAFRVRVDQPQSTAQFEAWLRHFRAGVFVCDTRIAGSCPADLEIRD